VFKSEKVKWWRGAPLPEIPPNTAQKFVLSFPAYIMLKNNYDSIYVNLYTANYSKFIDKSARLQHISSRVAIGENVNVMLDVVSKKAKTKYQTSQLKKSRMILGAKSELRTLLRSAIGASAQLKRITETTEGEKKEEVVAEFEVDKKGKAEQDEELKLLEEQLLAEAEDEELVEPEDEELFSFLSEETLVIAEETDESSLDINTDEADLNSTEEIVEELTEEEKQKQVLLEEEQLLLEQVQVDSTDISSREKLVELYMEQKESSKAITFLSDALKKNPKDLNAYLNLSKIYQNEGNPQKALEVLTYSLERLSVSSRMAVTEELKQKVEKGKSGISKLSDAAYLANEYEKLGMAYLKQEQFDQALTTFTTMKNFLPDFQKVNYHIGKSQLGLKQYHEAVASFWEQDKQTANHLENLDGLTQALPNTDDMDSTKKAISSYQGLKQNNPTSESLSEIDKNVAILDAALKKMVASQLSEFAKAEAAELQDW